jgi:hypothetical protein
MKNNVTIQSLFDNTGQTLYFFDLLQRAFDKGLTRTEFSKLFTDAKNLHKITGDTEGYAYTLTAKKATA